MSNTIKMPKRFDYSAMGDFNMALSAALLAVKEDGKILLDCEAMDYIDSSGLGLLVMAHKKVQENNYSIVVTNTKSFVREILLLANLQKLIDIR